MPNWKVSNSEVDSTSEVKNSATVTGCKIRNRSLVGGHVGLQICIIDHATVMGNGSMTVSECHGGTYKFEYVRSSHLRDSNVSGTGTRIWGCKVRNSEIQNSDISNTNVTNAKIGKTYAYMSVIEDCVASNLHIRCVYLFGFIP